MHKNKITPPRKPYSIGLDIGTKSVGWAVVTDDYKVPAKKMPVRGNTDKTHIKKNLLGALLFDDGKPAEDRRLKRNTRRRYTRRKNRLRYLQAIFKDEMDNVDPSFFMRLEESFYVPKDKRHNRHPIFANQEEESAYHKNYPTIYHLRKALADNPEKADLRLVYLALAHMIKYRGHFLIEGELDTENSKLQESFDSLVSAYNSLPDCENVVNQDVEVEAILSQKLSPSKKRDEVLAFYPGHKKGELFGNLIGLSVGLTSNFKKNFNLEEDAKLSFKEEGYEGDLESLLAQIRDDYADVFTCAKVLYDAISLSGILTVKSGTKAKLSASMVKRYEDHQKDLKALKAYIKDVHEEKYKDFFTEEKDKKKKEDKIKGYADYIAPNGINEKEFYENIKGIIKEDDDERARSFLDKIEKEDFLRKQRTYDNGSIPNQVHLSEMRAILETQGEFYPFLQEHKDKIEKIMTFRIPYYAGPLAQEGASDWAWIKRKSDEAIRPWNFDQVVDKSASAEAFIDRMTNYCQYLPKEKVLPKHSHLYETYAVYNELTKVTYTDENGNNCHFDAAMKAQIVKECFKNKNKKTVSKKGLESFLETHYEGRITGLQGIDKKFNASLGTYHDLSKILGKAYLDDESHQEAIEELVKVLTLFEDKVMLKERLKTMQEKEGWTDKAVKELSRRHYTGWGRLSAKLIDGIRDKETNKTVLDFLKDDDALKGKDGDVANRNLMQLLRDDRLSFKSIIDKAQSTRDQDISTADAVASLAGSPAIKKSILQTLKVVDELVGIMGYAPSSIVVEMARENQSSKTTNNREEKLTKMLKELGEEAVVLNHGEEALKKDRLYLYYLQNGRDMYTGEPLDIDNLSQYDIDHIIPQAFIKDDSIDNKVLVSSAKNRGKSDDVPSKEVVDKMKSDWAKLKEAGMVSERKYSNLTKAERGGLTDDDKAGFIKRQLVETRQITKHVARLLDERFNPQGADGKVIRDTRIITLKSKMVSDFRREYGLYKVREINDYHHAHDAYLNAVVATALLKMYPNLDKLFVYGMHQHINWHQIVQEQREKGADKEVGVADVKKAFYSNLTRFFKQDRKEKAVSKSTGEIAWDKEKDFDIVRKVLSYPQVNIVKKVEVQTGGFSKESILPKGDSDKLIPRKTKKLQWETQKYGGFDSPTVAYSVFVVADVEKGKIRKLKTVKELVGISIMERSSFEENPVLFLEKKGYHNVQEDKLIKLPKYSLFEFEGGRRRLLVSATELQKGNEVMLPAHLVELLYHAHRIDSFNSTEHLKYVSEHKTEFEKVLSCVEDFSNLYVDVEKNLSKVRAAAESMTNFSLEEISASFINLLTLTALGAPADFNFLGEKIPRKRYTSTKECLSATLIHQSVTGLYETRIDLSKLGEE